MDVLKRTRARAPIRFTSISIENGRMRNKRPMVGAFCRSVDVGQRKCGSVLRIVRSDGGYEFFCVKNFSEDLIAQNGIFILWKCRVNNQCGLFDYSVFFSKAVETICVSSAGNRSWSIIKGKSEYSIFLWIKTKLILSFHKKSYDGRFLILKNVKAEFYLRNWKI